MTEMTLTKIRFHNGVWEGRLEGAPKSGARPDIRLTYMDRACDGLELSEGDKDGVWQVSVTIPSEAIGDGVQTFLILNGDGNDKLADFCLIGGDPAGDDFLAEISLLRAELDMLKRAFRRHCLETM
ncbi:MAG: hypothetical protein ACU0BB_14420 [Paracoccaceae bacterium]